MVSAVESSTLNCSQRNNTLANRQQSFTNGRDVQEWLAKIGLEKYSDHLYQHEIGGHEVFDCDNDALKEIGIDDVRDRLLFLVEALRLKRRVSNINELPFSSAVASEQPDSVCFTDNRPLSDTNRNLQASVNEDSQIINFEEDELDPYLIHSVCSNGLDETLTSSPRTPQPLLMPRSQERYNLRTGEDKANREPDDSQINTDSQQPSPEQDLRRTVLKKYFGQRPSSELIANNLPEYFPLQKEVLRKTVRNSVRFSLAISRKMASQVLHSENDTRQRSDLSVLAGKGGSVGQILLRRRSSMLAPFRPVSVAETLFEEDEETKNEEDALEPNVDSFQEPESNTEKRIPWLKGALIGAGSFGNVYLGMNAVSGELMAVKTVTLPSKTTEEQDNRKSNMVSALQHEIALLRDLEHENIVQYIGSQSEEENLCIFLEYVPGGSVSSLLNTYGAFEEPLIQTFIRQTLEGLKYLHERGIIHRDIKGANVLVDNKGIIKISDFGISKKLDTAILSLAAASNIRQNRFSMQGSIFWIAPEVIKQIAHTKKSDIWSVGCLVIEMMTAQHPFSDLNQIQAIFKIGNMTAPSYPEAISEKGRDFLNKSFELDYANRCTAVELLSHPFLMNETLTTEGANAEIW